MLPLELVINKDSKSKDHSDSISIKCRLSDTHKNISFNDNEALDINNDTDKVSIPTETHNVVQNIRNHLRNEDDYDSVSLQNSHVRECKFQHNFINIYLSYVIL